MTTLDELRVAEKALTAATAAMTEHEKFNTGWRITDSLNAVREAIYTLSDPKRMIT